ncbi:MAG: phosphoribosylanthranilate isomerase [Kiritimatiellae bacterium]|nr:phosphoribosylanthranilate isomerase [Kiritimatiellia bacterium]
MPRLKVCGITDAAFAVEAARRGIDYLGLIFAEGSPRRVTEEQAREIVAAVRRGGTPAVPAGPRFVGVFVGHDVEKIKEVASFVAIDVIQLHGDYGAYEIAMLKADGYEVWRLFGGHDVAVAQERDPPDAVLLDGRKGAQRGGTGMRADWSLVGPLKRAGRRVVLAGGISAANVVEAAATGADVIDVNSSIETAPGVKSLALLDELLRAGM